MSKFVVLTKLDPEGEPVMVNVALVDRVERTTRGNAVLFFSGDRQLPVAESLANFTLTIAEWNYSKET